MNPMITQMRNSFAVTLSSFLKAAMLLNMQITRASKPPKNPPPKKLINNSIIIDLRTSFSAFFLYMIILFISCVISMCLYKIVSRRLHSCEKTEVTIVEFIIGLWWTSL